MVDLHAEPGLQSKWKRNGSNLPGYWGGWFTLAGKHKALVFITDRRRVVYLPTHDGYVLLLSVAEVEGFLRALGRAS